MPSIVATNTSNILVDNWKKINTSITYADTAGYKQISLPPMSDASWIQIKAELRGEGGVVGIQELQLVTNINQKAI
jgi:hypothetical protein